MSDKQRRLTGGRLPLQEPPEPWDAGSLAPAYGSYPPPAGIFGWSPPGVIIRQKPGKLWTTVDRLSGGRPCPPRRRRSGLVVTLALLGCGLLGCATVVSGMAGSDPDAGPGVPGGVAAVQPSRSSILEVVNRDGFYGTGRHRSTGCREPIARLTDPRTMTAYYATVKKCLDRAWARRIPLGGDAFRPAEVLFWSRHLQSPCSAGRTGPSFYCGTNRTVYLRYDDDLARWRSRPDPDNRSFARMWAAFTVAHVYGHHVQQLTGILPAAHQLRYGATARERRLELARRIELQASCLGSAFLGANATTYGIAGRDLRVYREYVERAGDEDNPSGTRDHGSRASHRFWMSRGFGTRDSASCNTFTASASKVS